MPELQLQDPPNDIIDHFRIGMDRPFSDLYRAGNGGRRVNLGAGKKQIRGYDPLDAENGWYAGQRMPFDDGEVGEFVAYHFLEHLTKKEVLSVLREVQRCLRPGGGLTALTPHYTAEIAHQDLDHKSTWTESTWRNLLQNQYYEGTMPRDWKLREIQTTIIGHNMRNLMVLSRLELPW